MAIGDLEALMRNVEEKADSYDINKDVDISKHIIPDFID